MLSRRCSVAVFYRVELWQAVTRRTVFFGAHADLLKTVRQQSQAMKSAPAGSAKKTAD